MPRCNDVDTGCVITSTTSPDAKAGRRFLGTSHERARGIDSGGKANTTVQTVEAVSGAAAEWFAIDWQSVNRNVRRLQVRIVQAWKAGRWNKVKALQHLLTCSYSGKVLAVRRVTENAGKKTPGVDGEIWDTPAKKAQSVHMYWRNGYRGSTAQMCLHPEKAAQQNDAPPRNSHHEGQSDASTTFARPRSRW